MDELFTRRVAKVLPEGQVLQQLMKHKSIRVYLGIDPTGGMLHIGHAIGIKKLMEFASAGHEAILLFGTGTVLVGDPSLRETSRTEITTEEIIANIQTWKDQVAPIVDFDKVQIRYNADWINTLTLTDIIAIASKVSAVQLFKRESFTRRIERGDTVWYHETMYPLLQGYDSVVLDVDLEIGGTDQEFNMLMGRELQKKMNNREKWVLTTPMILGTDGQQMSKTSGNCVWLQDPPEVMFGKLMTIHDHQIIPYMELCTDMALSEIADIEMSMKAGANPKESKLKMAYEITSIWHSRGAAKDAQAAWTQQFSQGDLPSNIPEIKLAKGKWELVELLVRTKLATSKSEARRLIQQGGIKHNQQQITNTAVDITSGDILQAGKRRFIKII